MESVQKTSFNKSGGGGVIGSENKWEVSRTDGNDMKQHGSRLPVPLNSNGM